MNFSFIDTLKFDDQGLLPCVVQDADTNEVLMVAYMSRESLRRTLEKGLCTFFSRSRQALWLKGETSGHTQEVREVRLDCDSDTLLIRVKQNGAACHAGFYSCFYRRLRPDGTLEESGERVFDPETVYRKK
ncbi:MAG: phosphoribosyl-AMP cyclohydrolase [Planctomycetota bacterium]